MRDKSLLSILLSSIVFLLGFIFLICDAFSNSKTLITKETSIRDAVAHFDARSFRELLINIMSEDKYRENLK